MIQKIAREGNEVVCVFSGVGEVRVNVAALTGSPSDRVEKVRATIQKVIDKRIPLTDLPVDEPARLDDPALPNFFWSDNLGDAAATVKTHLCARGWAVTVEPTTYVLTFEKTYVS